MHNNGYDSGCIVVLGGETDKAVVAVRCFFRPCKIVLSLLPIAQFDGHRKLLLLV
jgi:hypothetical protein